MEKNNMEVHNTIPENNYRKFFTFDEIYKARMVVGMSFLSLFIVVISIVIFFIFFRNTQNKILERIKERDIVVLTRGGAVIGKTTPILDEVAKQFALTTFTSSLIYDSKDPIPQLNFMRIYSTPQIFKRYREMVQQDSISRNVARKIYYATISTNKGIQVETIKENEIFKVSFQGERMVVTNFSDANNSYPFKLEITIQKNNNTPIENMYGFVITGFNFTKI